MPIDIMLRRGLCLSGLVILASFAMRGGYADAQTVPLPAQKPLQEVEVSSAQDTILESKAIQPSKIIPVPYPKPQQFEKITKALGTPDRKPKGIKPATQKDSAIRTASLSSSVRPSTIKDVFVFTDRQSRILKEIFTLQEKGNIPDADRKMNQLNNDLLRGHILAERYLHPTAYNSSYAELANWLKKYSDHPQAQKIYKLALIKNPQAKGSLKKPQSKKVISGNLNALTQKGKKYRSTKIRNTSQNARVQKLSRDLDKHIRKQQPTMALNILSNDYAVQFIDDVEYDRFRAMIAASYMHAGKLKDAQRLSEAALKRSGASAPLAGWVNGLVQWQQKNYRVAAQSFEVTAASPYASGWMVSAAAYWASRAHMRGGNAMMVSKWLGLSASYPRTFYGLIATRALGHDSHFNWSIPSLSRDQIKLIENTARGKRAAALLKADMKSLAEEELKFFNIGNSLQKKEALLAYANYYHLPGILMRVGNTLAHPKGGLYDAALYPVADFEPRDGYDIDKALIYAFIRQESRFNQLAANPSGATGLMQLMPTTATHVSGKSMYQNAAGQHQLKKPEINLALGQDYIEELLNHRAVKQDLMALAIAYNAGPGNLSKWKAERSHIKDPLLFIETIPFNETRAFVERVLSNYWIYQMRFNQDTPSLDAVAEGKWAQYIPPEKYQRMAAR